MKGTMIKICLAALAIGATSAWAEKELSADKLPVAVLAAAKQACPNGTIKEAMLEKDDGVMVYEVEMMADGMSCDVKISKDGKLLEVEQQLAIENLPKKVMATLKKFDDLTVRKAERVQEDGKVFFEINAVMDDQGMELKITEEGKITGLEPKGKKQEEDDDEDEEHEDKD